MMPRMKSHRLLLCLTAAALVIHVPSFAETVWPTNGWTTSTPSAQGMDGAKLDAALAAAQKQNLALHSMLVIRHGYVVKEKYYPPVNAETADELYSCTKSFVSALVGIAIDKGYIADVSRPVLGFFPGRTFEKMDPRKKAMTLEDLLTMSSGLGWVEGDATYRQMYETQRDWVKFILGLPMAAVPGKQFNYSSGNTHILSAIIQETTPKNVYDFACEHLFVPLGIGNPRWNRDPTGIPIGGWGLKLTPREMAKLGYLYLHEGAWDGKQVVPAAWVRNSTTPHIAAGSSRQYGYQWWISQRGKWFAAFGRFGQSIFVVPSLDLVVVFTAKIDSNDSEAELLEKYIMPACRAG
jgi:CubicO group peptidase (beta-lactamase class C family)